MELLATVSRGDFLIHGFRNPGLRELLHGPQKATIADQRRQSFAVTRPLRLLQAHVLIKKQANTHRYQVTEKGQRAITALLAARSADVASLMTTAA